MREPERVLAVGDLHGNAHAAQMSLEYARRNGCDAIVQVGDFGLWRNNDDTARYLGTVEREAAELDIDFYWLDGNHEDHTRIDHGWVTAQYTTLYKRIIYLPRGYRWTWWGKRFMAVGGAVSVDKHMRTAGKSWWPEEELTDSQVEYACRDDGTPVDVVFSHDCPLGVDIPGVGRDLKTGNTNGWPYDVLLEAERHRIKMRKIFDATRPKLWTHGHYHVRYQAFLGLEPTAFVGLGCDGDRMFNLCQVISPEDIE